MHTATRMAPGRVQRFARIEQRMHCVRDKRKELLRDNYPNCIANEKRFNRLVVIIVRTAAVAVLGGTFNGPCA